MTDVELRQMLDAAVRGDHAHVERLTLAAAVIAEILHTRGMQATLVGGGAIEFHTEGVLATSDVDLVVEGRTREELDGVLRDFGFERRGRHWVRGDLFLEVPGNWMSDPVDVVTVGPFALRVIRRETVLADRIVGYKHWRTTAYGAQAIAMLSMFGQSVDSTALRTRVRAEGAEDAYEALADLARRRTPVSDEDLRTLLDRLHGDAGTHTSSSDNDD